MNRRGFLAGTAGVSLLPDVASAKLRRERPPNVFALAGDELACATCGVVFGTFTRDVRRYEPMMAADFQFPNGKKPVPGRQMPHCCGEFRHEVRERA